jgi:hypothetical protein
LLASNLFREICFTTFEMMIPKKSSHIIPSYSSDPDKLHRFTQRFRRWSLQERGVSLLPARLRHADRAALDHHEGVVRGVDVWGVPGAATLYGTAWMDGSWWKILFIMENPWKIHENDMDDLGYPHELGSLHMLNSR